MKTEKQKLEMLVTDYLCESYKNEMNGKLSGLMSVYESYDNLEALSPFEVFGKPEIRKLVKDFQRKYPEENLIEYCVDDILVNPRLMMVYLQLIDFENFDKFGLHGHLNAINTVIQDIMGIEHCDETEEVLYVL